MQNWVTFFILSNEGFGINTNLFETNIINILIFVPVILATAGKAVKQMIDDRATVVCQKIENAEKRLTDARNSLVEATEKAKQAKILIAENKKEASKKELEKSLECREKGIKKFQEISLVTKTKCKNLEESFKNEEDNKIENAIVKKIPLQLQSYLKKTMESDACVKKSLDNFLAFCIYKADKGETL